eukprot:COSAG02_NODE_41740_length_391_cov_1.068493_2_plen_74_part_01
MVPRRALDVQYACAYPPVESTDCWQSVVILYPLARSFDLPRRDHRHVYYHSTVLDLLVARGGDLCNSVPDFAVF